MIDRNPVIISGNVPPFSPGPAKVFESHDGIGKNYHGMRLIWTREDGFSAILHDTLDRSFTEVVPQKETIARFRADVQKEAAKAPDVAKFLKSTPLFLSDSRTTDGSARRKRISAVLRNVSENARAWERIEEMRRNRGMRAGQPLESPAKMQHRLKSK